MTRSVARRPAFVLICATAMLSWAFAAHAQTVDPGFNPGANQVVLTVAVQPDGKIVVGGQFTGLGGVTGTTTRNRIGRLNIDGSVDPGFNPGTNGPVQAVALQPDGKILIGGNFTSVGGGTGLTSIRSHIARLNADGSVDLGFNPGANNNVYAIAVQPDGKILVGGEFSAIGGGGAGSTPRSRLARLNPDGSPDTFDPGASKLPAGASAIIYTMALQPDGKVVVGGYFNGLGGGTGATVRNYIGRINADGSLDAAFNPGASFMVNAVALQADGKIIVGGDFTGLGAGTGLTLRSNIGRLNADGSVDISFNPGVESQVLTLGVQADGKILAGGYFKWMGAAGGPSRSTRMYVGRMNPDGSVDNTFNPGAGNIVDALAIQPDGAIVAAGVFLTVGDGTGLSTARNNIARFPTTNAANQTLTLSGGGSAPSVMTWLRSGAGPEVSAVTFEFSFDGSFYSLLGSGARITGGWQLTAVNLPTTRRVWIRARGSYGTGFQNGSGSIIESIYIQNPILTRRDGDFDGDGKADITVFRPSAGTWFTRFGSGATTATQWGNGLDIPVPGDYNGDGLADIAVFRPSDGTWYILYSGSGGIRIFQWGNGNDQPVPADYDGDGTTDVAVFRPSNGTWFISYSATASTGVFAWGNGADKPVAADYDGDGHADVAVFRPSDGTWYILNSATSTVTARAWGNGADIAVPGDYNGDGRADVAVFRPSDGTWYVLFSASNSVFIVQWGNGADVPVTGDFDGDGKTDIGVFRPSTGVWFVLKSSSSSFDAVPWGNGADIPILRRQ